MLKICVKHGKTDFSSRVRNNYPRCKKCATESVTKRRRKLKILAIEYKGGKCIVCGYDKCQTALQFHHRDPNKKDFGLSSKGITRAWHKVKKELNKCDLLCANCHAEKHEELYDVGEPSGRGH